MIKKRTSRLLAVTTGISAAGFLLCAAHVMSVFSSYIYKFHATSLFQDTAAWLAGHFEKPAALLVYCGRFLTQFCYFPGVAILLLTGLYALISWLCYRYFLRGSALPVLSLLPALALYLSLMRMGYGVLVFRADALIFTEPVGILSALLLFRLLQAGEGKVRWIVALLGYPLFGCYALLALLIHAVWSLSHPGPRLAGLRPLADLLLIAAVPPLEYLLLYDHTVFRYMWFQGGPFLDYVANAKEMIPLLLAALLPVLLAVRRPAKREPASWTPYLTLAIGIGMVVCVYLLPYRNALFHRQMIAERAIEKGDWDTVADKTCSLKLTNDILVSYRNCALYAQGRLERDCMKYSFNMIPVTIGDKEYSSSLLAGPTLFFYSGLLNYAARISSEISLYANYAVERWKFLAKVAVFNGETHLADKYIETLAHTTLHKAWARRYRDYLEHPERLALDPEYRLLSPLQDYEEKRWMPSDNAAANVLLFYSYVPGDSPQMQEWNRAAQMMLQP